MKRRAAPGLALAMDIGTSSLRTALFSLDGHRHEATTSQQTYRLRTADDGAAELPPAALLAAAIKALTATLSRQDADRALRGQPIIAWGTSCFWHSLLGIDQKYAALSPIYTWADSRCAADAARLREALSEPAVHARTGCMLRASFWPAKLAWLRLTQQSLVRRVAHWVSPVDFLHAQFCGELRPSLSMTSGAGMLDLASRSWDKEIARAVGFRPTHEPGFESAGPLFLKGKFAAKFPRLRETPILPAIGDGAASNLGSGATRRGVAAINYGTSSAARIVRTGVYRPAPMGLFCYAIDSKRWLVGGATSNAGNVYQWASDVFRVEAAVRHHPEPSPSLVALPFLNGERAPTWREDLPAAFIGMRQNHTAADLHRAFTDATFIRLAQIVAPLEKAAGVRLRFVISGGLSRSASSVQRLVNALDRRCQASDEPEASLRGAAVFALEEIGHKTATPRWSSILKPDPRIARLYAAARKRQTLLEEGFTELTRRLREID